MLIFDTCFLFHSLKLSNFYQSYEIMKTMKGVKA